MVPDTAGVSGILVYSSIVTSNGADDYCSDQNDDGGAAVNDHDDNCPVDDVTVQLW